MVKFFVLTVLGNAIMLVIVSVLGRTEKFGAFSLLHLFKIIASFELGVALIATLVYCGEFLSMGKALSYLSLIRFISN